MALEQNLVTVTHPSAGDLSTKQFYFVKLDSSGNVVLCDTAGEQALGVLQNNPAGAGRECAIAVGGVTKVIASATIAVGALIATDASGKAKAAVKGTANTADTGAAADPLVGSFVLGQAESDGANGALMSVLLRSMGAVPTTAA